MGPDLTPIDVFVASPGDCGKERTAVGTVVDEINRINGEREGWFCRVRLWETDARPGLGRAQQLILDQIGIYDILVGIMAKKFGTPTTKAGSGTEEEFDSAYTAHIRRKHKPEILFYFRDITLRNPSDYEIDQYQKVQAFKKKVFPKAMAWSYPRINAFADRLRPHLVKAARAAYAKRKADGKTDVPSNNKGKVGKDTLKAPTRKSPTRKPKPTSVVSTRSNSAHQNPQTSLATTASETTLLIPRVRRAYTDADKRRYTSQAYAYILRSIEKHTAELNRATRGVKATSEGTNDGQLIVTVESGGRVIGGLRLWIDNNTYQLAICYRAGAHAVQSQHWGSQQRFVLQEAAGELGFSSNSYAWGQQHAKQKEIAEQVWKAFCDELPTK